MWISGINRTDCITCQSTYAPHPWDNEKKRKIKENGAPCKTCKPEMWPINSKAIFIYNHCSDQVIISMSGVIAIKQNAVLERIKLEGVKRKYQLELLDDVLFISRKVISLRNEKKREDGLNKKRR